MNHTGPGLLSDVCKEAIRLKLSSVITDTDAAVTLTVSTPTGSNFDYASGVATVTTTEDSVTALLQSLSNREVEASGGVYQLGDRLLRVMASDITTLPTVDSAVVVTSDDPDTTYSVVESRRDLLGQHYRIILRRRE